MFLAFFTPELIDYIVVETNRYASVCLSSTHCGDGPVPQWETDSSEVKAYLGLCILMGMNKLPDLYDYWSTDEAFHYTPVASRITRKRFLEIQWYLHFTNNDNIVSRGEPGYDRLAKVRPVIQSVQQSFLANYKPHKENAIDEAMIKYKGRSALKQYLPLKPIKRGFKVWVRADSINGYMCDFEVYTGKDGSPEQHLGSKVVDITSTLTIFFHLWSYLTTSSRMICMPVARFAGTGKGSLLPSKKRIKVFNPKHIHDR